MVGEQAGRLSIEKNAFAWCTTCTLEFEGLQARFVCCKNPATHFSAWELPQQMLFSYARYPSAATNRDAVPPKHLGVLWRTSTVVHVYLRGCLTLWMEVAAAFSRSVLSIKENRSRAAKRRSYFFFAALCILWKHKRAESRKNDERLWLPHCSR